MTPQARASKELFGFEEYVPAMPNVRYALEGGGEERVSWNELVEKYAKEEHDAAIC